MQAARSLVWFKRDLRVHDHAPLVAALAQGEALGLFVVEPEWAHSPECDASHVDLVLACLAELRAALAERGMPLLVRVGSAVPVLEQLRSEVAFTRLLSHEETGPGWSYVRDRQVAAWCKSADLPTLDDLGLATHSKILQAAGEKAARSTLQSFLQRHGYDYRKALSSLLAAQDGSRRLSPHLAFGTLSMRTVHQATEVSIASTPDHSLAYALRGFAGRLRWHCHFMQELEYEPTIEFNNFARVHDGLRENDFNDAYFVAWCAGRTGYPMVDACMRSLVATGWMSFRMRAMLVSYASDHLWLHWRQTGMFLARQFLDYEPGIHWSQMQMQSGTTGINTLRMYSPTKQAQDQDPQGLFIRRWVPELAKAPLPSLAEPWKMDISVQRMAGCKVGMDYPAPIVDDKEAMKAAKDRLYGLRITPQARAEAGTVQARHGSRTSGLPASGKKRSAPSSQGDLFA